MEEWIEAIDDEKRHDRYGRVLAVVYVDSVNLNRELLRRGYAEVMYIPPSEFNPPLRVDLRKRMYRHLKLKGHFMFILPIHSI